MKSKVVLIGTEARNSLIKGANFLADAVKTTLGPYGQNFILEKGDRVTNDGVSIASEIELDNEVQNRGLMTLRKAAKDTNSEAGDGTTTAIVLAQAILSRAVTYLGDEQKGLTAKKTPAEIIKQIETERVEVTEKLEKMAEPIISEEQLIQSATVSVENEELGRLIGKAQWELGPDGILIAEDTAEKSSSVEKINGIRIDNGFGTSVVMNNQEKETLEVGKTHILLTNHTIQISDLAQQVNEKGERFGPVPPLMKLIIQLSRVSQSLVIVARAFTQDAIQVCVNNINSGSVKIYPLNAPYVDQSEIMKDMAAVVGGNFINSEAQTLEDINVSDLGLAGRVVASRYNAIITGEIDELSKQRVAKRIGELEERYAGSNSEFEKRNIKQRIAQLTNGFAIVKVGATSEVERKYKHDKVEDAVNAVRSAYQEGVVPGAGKAFENIAKDLPDTYLLKRPLMSIIEQIKATAPEGFVIGEWVKDPVKVLRVALKNACSVAGTLATAAGVVTTKRDKPKLFEVKE